MPRLIMPHMHQEVVKIIIAYIMVLCEQAEQAPKILNNLSKERGDDIGLYCGKGLGLGDISHSWAWI